MSSRHLFDQLPVIISMLITIRSLIDNIITSLTDLEEEAWRERRNNTTPRQGYGHNRPNNHSQRVAHPGSGSRGAQRAS